MSVEHAIHEGRVLEAKDNDASGGRVYRVRVIKYGDSKNRRRYPEAVMRGAVGRYDGAKAYDHHRTDEELRTSTVGGMVGWYEGVTAEADGLYADLHLLPGATHVAEALDASLALQARNLPPLVGTSHDVMGKFRPVGHMGRVVQEATEITSVASVDIVANPSAGGLAVRAVAGGVDDDEADESARGDEMPAVALEDVLEALKEASDEQLAAVGLARATEADEDENKETAKPDPGKQSEQDKPDPDENDPDEDEEATEAVFVRGSTLAKLTVGAMVTNAQLPDRVTEGIIKGLPQRFTEADVTRQIKAFQDMRAFFEAGNAGPTAPTVQVSQEAFDKKKAALDDFFAGKYNSGYSSFRQAYMDFTGKTPKTWDEDFNRTILRESIGHFDSRQRATEAMDTTSWNYVLGDSITRRMVQDYQNPSLQTWKQIVSSTVPVNDFRTQRIDRIGGYGVLPAVNQGAPYQPLTSPGNEEVTYAITKRGGTEEITLEMIANDDVRAISKIPTKLGRAAAHTLYRFVWEMINPTTNPTVYDGLALYHASHGNTDTNAFSQANLSIGRRKMRDQVSYGDSLEILGLTPKFLLVPNELEEHAWEVVTSSVAMPSTAPVGGASDVPNIHQGMNLLVMDYWTDDTAWALVADPNTCPTLEVGFYQGRETPELFTQSDPTVGSMFDADKLTYKIRHIYSGAILDYRAFYRGNT